MFAIGEVPVAEVLPHARGLGHGGWEPTPRPLQPRAVRRGPYPQMSRSLARTALCLTAAQAVRAHRLTRSRLKAAGSAGGSTPLSLGTSKTQVQAPTEEEEEEDSSSWALPSVDKDISEYNTGHAPSYAWVQTSETLYLFTPLLALQVKDGEKQPANVQLNLTNEGTLLRLVVEGKVILDGRLSHSIKPGDELWMIEEAPDGRDFVVVELDKLLPGMNWASVLEPQVEVLGRYANPVVEMPDILTEEEESLVDETLQHLQRTKRVLQPVEGRTAARGDVISVDMQGYEMNEDGSRGEEMDVGSAKGLELELGASTFSAEVEQSLEGIAVSETRDVQVTLGQRAGGMGGKQIICAVTCQEIKEQLLPELDDDFAKEIKREEQFKQAGTAEGIPEEEEGIAENFCLADLRAEIGREVRQVAQTQSNDVVDSQLRSHLLQTLKVKCHWANLGSQEATEDEELAVAIHFLAEKEGILQNIDMDDVERKTWAKLGEPDEGETIAQVGKDPPREYQDAHREILRDRLQEEVFSWLRHKMEVVEAGERQ